MAETTERRVIDRRGGQLSLTEEQIDLIAERAANRAIEKMTEQAYLQVGKTVISKGLWLFGLIFMGTVYWLNGKGLLKWP
jgi:hypothetical protein